MGDATGILNKIRGTFGEFSKNECSLYNNKRHGGSCREIVYKYIAKELAKAPWEEVISFYGCVNQNGTPLGESAVFEKAVTNSESPAAAKKTYLEDLKHFKPRSNKIIPKGQGTPIAELNQLMEQFKNLYPEIELYYVPLVKGYKNYHTPDIM